MDNFLRAVKAVADRQRIRILSALSGGELCVCQVTALLRLAPSTVSKHLLILRRAGLVESRKTERWIYYRLACRPDRPDAISLLKFLQQRLKDAPVLRRDRVNLARLKKIDRCTLSRTMIASRQGRSA